MNIRDTAAIPANIAKLMSPADRKAIGSAAELPTESAAKFERKAEREMHEQFIQWLNLNGITYIRSRMDKRSTTEAGTPDFICLKGPRGACVEMKVPGGKLSEAQASYIRKLEADHIPVLVAYSVKDAIQFCRETLL